MDLTGSPLRARIAQERKALATDPEHLAQLVRRALHPDAGPQSFMLPNRAASSTERVEWVKQNYAGAVELFGLDAVTAASRTGSGCRWCLARSSASVHQRTSPLLTIASRVPGQRWKVRRAFEALLGPACATCTAHVDRLSRNADAARLAAIRARTPKPQPTATTTPVRRPAQASTDAMARAVVASGRADPLVKRGKRPAPTGYLVLGDGLQVERDISSASGTKWRG